MHKILFALLLITLAIAPTTGQMAIVDVPHTISVTLTTNSHGNTSLETRLIQGELLGLEYLNGNFTGAGVVRLLDDHGIQIDTYNLSSGNTYRVPGVKITNSTDAWHPYTLSSTLWLNMTLQQVNKTAAVRIMYR
jgi:hypothetical protein